MTASVDQGYRLLAAKYVGKQTKQLAEQLDGVRQAEDVEFVHRARVATRRLRAAMRMFGDCFDAKQLKRWRKPIRRVTVGLGDARDKDVQIEFLCGVLERLEDKACYPAVARLLVTWQRRRERLQPDTVEAVDRLEASEVLRDMQAATKPVLQAAKAKDLSVQSPAAYAQTERHILNNLDQLMQHRDGLADPNDQQRHHAMRIAAKRLRYTTEISKPVYAGQLDGTIEAVKKLQTLLGEIHDCDVWAEHLRVFADKQRKRIVKYFGHATPFARLKTGLEYLQQDRLQRRRGVFQELVGYWRELNEQGHWDKLVAMLRARGRQPAGPAQPELPADAATPPTPPPHFSTRPGNEAGPQAKAATQSDAEGALGR